MAGEWKKLLDKVPADKRAAVEAAISEVGDFAAELDSGVMRQDDYSRKMNAWKTEKETMQTNWNTAKEQFDEMQEKFNNHEATMGELTEAKNKADRLEQELNRVKTQAPAIDPEKVVTKEDMAKAINEFGSGQVAYFNQSMDLAFELESLTKARVNPSTIIAEALKAKKSPADYVEEKYKLSELRTKHTEAERAEHETKIRSEERQKTIAELTNPSTRPLVDSKDPFIATKEDDKAKQPWELTDKPADEAKFEQELFASQGR